MVLKRELFLSWVSYKKLYEILMKKKGRELQDKNAALFICIIHLLLLIIPELIL